MASCRHALTSQLSAYSGPHNCLEKDSRSHQTTDMVSEEPETDQNSEVMLRISFFFFGRTEASCVVWFPAGPLRGPVSLGMSCWAGEGPSSSVGGLHLLAAVFIATTQSYVATPRCHDLPGRACARPRGRRGFWSRVPPFFSFFTPRRKKIRIRGPHVRPGASRRWVTVSHSEGSHGPPAGGHVHVDSATLARTDGDAGVHLP